MRILSRSDKHSTITVNEDSKITILSPSQITVAVEVPPTVEIVTENLFGPAKAEQD